MWQHGCQHSKPTKVYWVITLNDSLSLERTLKHDVGSGLHVLIFHMLVQQFYLIGTFFLSTNLVSQLPHLSHHLENTSRFCYANMARCSELSLPATKTCERPSHIFSRILCPPFTTLKFMFPEISCKLQKNQIFIMPSVGNRHSHYFSSSVPHLQCGLWSTSEPALSFLTKKEMCQPPYYPSI